MSVLLTKVFTEQTLKSKVPQFFSLEPSHSPRAISHPAALTLPGAY